MRRFSKKLNKQKRWKHDDLAEDLALAKGGIPFLNICLGQSWQANTRKYAQRADLLVCLPSYKRFTISIYEIKVSRADFLSDIRSEKWKGYLDNCHRFYFATPKGIISKDEIPTSAGWIVRGPRGWHIHKKPDKLNNTIERNTLLSLIFARQRRGKRERRLDDVQDMNSRSYIRSDFKGRLKACRVLGNDLGKLHEAAMKIGGINKATKILVDLYERNNRLNLRRIYK